MTEEEYTQRVKDMRNRVVTLDREGKYWSDDDVKTLRAMFRGGTGITEIAVRLCRSETAIIQETEKLGLFERKYPPRLCTRGKASVPNGCLCGKCPEKGNCPRRCLGE